MRRTQVFWPAHGVLVQVTAGSGAGQIFVHGTIAHQIGGVYLCLFPGLAIMITVLAFNLVGDALRDAMDPKLKN